VGSSECNACGASLCPHCQRVVDPAATRCFACGTRFLLTCDHCGGEVDADDAICPHCGERFEELA
jgi:RNA polymerase subunit RPABC4/transcription elongation factor Spt4